MKFYPLVLCVGLLLSGLAACDNSEEPDSTPPPTEEGAEGEDNETPAPEPPGDDVIDLTGSAAKKFYTLINRVDPVAECMGLGYINITEAENKEISDFTTTLVAGCTTDKEKYDKIIRWIFDNIQYGQNNNDPYPVFKNKEAVCQGFANLAKVMTLSQNIPTVSINGYKGNVGAHAWIYCYMDGKWYVSDPLAGPSATDIASDVAAYENMLKPSMADIDFAEENGFICNFYEEQYNIRAITAGGTSITLPEEMDGVRITSFIPTSELPSTIEEITLGSNITSLGAFIGLQTYGPNIKAVYVDEDNPELEAYKGIIYKKNGSDPTFPYYIPNMLEEITLKSMRVMGKNTLVNLPNLKTLHIAEGTEIIENWAVENCPQLKTIYLPASIKDSNIAENAFVKVAEDYETIRY